MFIKFELRKNQVRNEDIIRLLFYGFFIFVQWKWKFNVVNKTTLWTEH